MNNKMLVINLTGMVVTIVPSEISQKNKYPITSLV